MSDLLNFVLDQGEQFRRVRLPSLYSDFTLQRHVNPDGFAANVAAWEDVLQKATQAGLIPAPGNARDTLSLRTSEQLLSSLETKEWGRPLALDTVIQEAILKRHMIPFQEFLDSSTSMYARSWTFRPSLLFYWGLQQLGFSDRVSVGRSLRTANFVILPNVEEAAVKVLSFMSEHGSPVDRIYSMQMFRNEAAQAINSKDSLTDIDLNVLLTFLARDKQAVVYDSQIVKFLGPSDKSRNISDHDKTIVSLKTLIADLNVQVNLLTERVAELSKNAQKAISVKNRMSALAALRSRTLAETTIAQRLETLSQLEGVYSKIEQAADQVAVVQVMKASTGILRKVHAEVGGITKVEDTVEKLRKEMSEVDEIGNAIQEAQRVDGLIDEAAIDDELEALVQQSKAQTDEKEARKTEQRLAGIGNSNGQATSPQPQSEETPEAENPTSVNFKETFDVLNACAPDGLSLDERQVFAEVSSQAVLADSTPYVVSNG